MVITPADALENMRCILSRINNTVGRYETLVVLVGTSADLTKLHSNLGTIRDQMVDDVKKSRETFIEYCKVFLIENVSKDERDLFERLYAFYLTSIEYFRLQISRNYVVSLDFIEVIDSGVPVFTQICTGVVDVPSIVSSQYSIKSLKSSRKSSVENNNVILGSPALKKVQTKGNNNVEELKRLEKDFLDLGLILHDLYSSIHLSHWNIVPVIIKKDPDNQSNYSSEDDLDPNEKKNKLAATKQSKTQKRPKSASKNTANAQKPSVQNPSNKYHSQPRLLLKASYWNKKRKIRLIGGLLISCCVLAVVITIPCALLL